MTDPIRDALRDIEQNANEMAHVLIQLGFPIATKMYAKTIAARLSEIDRLTRQQPIVDPPAILPVTDP